MTTTGSASLGRLSVAEKRALLSELLRERTRSRTSFPLSFAQQRLWFLAQLDPESPSYAECVAVALSGPLALDVLARSVQEIIRRHEVLRTSIRCSGGVPGQSIAPPTPLHLPVVDLSSLGANDHAAEIDRRVRAEVWRPFDLAHGPLLRGTVLRLAAEEHVVLLVAHHIVADQWSAGVLLGELALLYDAFLGGQASPLPPLPMQYADYAVWQRQQLTEERLAADLAYWQRQLAGMTALDLPTDQPRPVVPTHRGARHRFDVSPGLTQELTALARREGATPFMIVLAAFQLLLQRYTGQDDVVVGAPVANRMRVQHEPLIGFFANTLLLRTDLAGDPPVRALLQRVRAVATQAYAHQELPFERLIEELHPARDPARPLPEAVLALQNVPMPALRLGDLSVRLLEVDPGTAKFDLLVALTETDGGLRGTLEYRTDLFDADTMTRMVGHFLTLLEGMVRDPNRPISALPLLTLPEHHQVLALGARTAELPGAWCLHRRFEEQAERVPEAVAVVCGAESVSYGELNARANRLAYRLLALGDGAAAPVGLFLERSVELVVGILAVLKAGRGYLPLETACPPERLAFILDDARPQVVVTQRQLCARLPAAEGLSILCVDDEGLPGAAPAGNPETSVTPDALAYVIYTSGSTGYPKGVLVTHRNVARLFEATDAWFRFRDRDVWTLFHSYAFDFSVWELWGALLHGGRLVVVPYWISRSPQELWTLLREQKVTVLNQTPSAFRQLIAAEPGDADAASSLRLVIFGGEMLEPHMLRPWFARHGDRAPQLVNMYGITETTVHVTYRPLTCADVEDGRGSMIGCAIPDLCLYVVDREGQLLPVGIPGELWVGGAGVARGYLNRPELTAARFIHDAFVPDAPGRVYRSGDRVRRHPSGDIEYLGRLDDQVKLRGFRIELGEIEAAVARCPGVQAQVIVLREDVPGDQRLVAYLVADPDGLPAAGELRRLLRERLPDYMIPAAFVRLDTLPLTANGKVDRRALPAPQGTSTGSLAAYVAPRDDIEGRLAGIWERCLGVKRVGVTQDFFELGGHSLLAVQLLFQIQCEFGRAPALAALFQAPSIEMQARLLAMDGAGEPWSPLVRMSPRSEGRPFFCVHPSAGHTLCFVELARCLGAERPLYALQARGLEEGQTPLTDLGAMAAAYAAVVCDAQTEGAIFLGGYSFGGVVAFEMARQLQARGRKVGLVALLDTAAPRPGGLILDEATRVAQLGAIVTRFFGLELPRAALAGLDPEAQLAYALEWLKAQGRLPAGFGFADARRLAEVDRANHEALRGYHPLVSSLPLVLFRASERTVDDLFDREPDVDGTRGWSALTTVPVTVVPVPGDHLTLITVPHVRVLAERLRAQLAAESAPAETREKEATAHDHR